MMKSRSRFPKRVQILTLICKNDMLETTDETTATASPVMIRWGSRLVYSFSFSRRIHFSHLEVISPFVSISFCHKSSKSDPVWLTGHKSAGPGLDSSQITVCTLRTTDWFFKNDFSLRIDLLLTQNSKIDPVWLQCHESAEEILLSRSNEGRQHFR